MVNAVRTLLLNGRPSPGAPGEGYVPPGFRPRTLPNELAAVRARLFGSTPDRVMMNYRLQQFMTLLHATDAVSFVLAKDPRITYGQTVDRSFFPADAFGAKAYVSGGPDTAVTVGGDPAAPDATGLTQQTFVLSVAAGRVTSARASSQFRLLDRPLTPPDTDVPLDQSGYVAQVTADNTDTFSAEVRVGLRPQWDVGQILAGFDTAGEQEMIALFGVSPSEPYRSFYNLFFTATENAYRLAGLLLALAWRTDELGETRGG